jgi:acetyl-CoA C-acetyltransferase
MFEQALRGSLRRSPGEHQAAVAELWAGFSEVAASNPHAWTPLARSAAEIATAGPDNRMIGFPYPKLMNSNNDVDMAAGVVVCSLERARALGLDEDRWVFPWSGADAHDTDVVGERVELDRSPGIAAAGHAALDLAGVGVDDLDHVDLYSCFPSAVQVAARELGLGLDRPLTVTGGLTFAGGPWNNYVMHAIATMVERLRAEPGATGLVTANGGYLSKHAMGVYASAPPPDGFRWASAQPQAEAGGRRDLAVDWAGDAVVESWTVMHERDGTPGTLFAAGRLADGRRAWGRSTDPDICTEGVQEDLLGRPVRLDGEGGLTLAG